jgi:mono/diheme cytochrome c family protein
MKRTGKSRLGALLAAGLVLAAQAAFADTAGMLKASDGEQVYQHICQGCHMPDGKGAVGAGSYPAFAGNANMASAQYVALTVLNGRGNMPSFAANGAGGGEFWERVTLTDEQVANVVNYIRSHFGNAYEDRLTAADVKAMHP